jgi:transcription-repair coupling factor (superfamily II helicase)
MALEMLHPPAQSSLPDGANPYRFVDLTNQEGEDALPAALVWQSVELAAPEFTPADLFGSQLRRFMRDVQRRASCGERVVVVSPQVARFQEMLEEGHADGVEWVHGSLEEGWHVPSLKLTCYTDTEIFGWRHRRRGMRRRKERDTDERKAFLRGLKPGEYVVHIEHGIARYEGLVRRVVGGVEREYLDLRFAGDDCLYVPVDQIDRVARYVGAGDAKPRLSRLGTQDWEQSKRKVRDAVEDLAGDLLDLYARRKLSDGYAFSPDNEWQQQLESSFPYVETEDQLRAMTEVKADMEEPHPMDRLICGDVGFGKTEVALRAAFKAVQDSKQVAILVPTTVLAQQHYETFKQRMAPFPIEVEMLSRFRSTRQQQDILRRLSSGKVDIIVGTHRLLSNDVVFKDLGLLIVDEEQRFGVRHKERLKQLRTEIDVLTMTATPIPRTLHMALAGIRDMSAINTPPDDRMPIKTYIVPYTKALVRDVIQRELDRGGQVYYVHNRVHSIYHVVERLRDLLPEVNFGVGHGQMDEGELEQVMLDFYAGQYDVLVCTTIIENGLDVPTVNTILIDDAPMYGLSQLYQLRGRVGRSARRAYAYLLYRKNQYMTQEAQQRLQAIQEAVELGAGFRIAMRDLEIRGAGNMLGSEQSGYIATVGFDLYSRLLEQAVKQLREHGAKQRTPATDGKQADVDAAQQASEGQAAAPQIRVDEKVLVSPLVTLTLPVSAYLPDEYIADEQVRFGVYQRMQEAKSVADVTVLRRELRDRFGELPAPVVHLLVWLEIKILAVNAGVSSVTTSDDALLVRLPEWADARERVQRRFARDKTVQVGGQFVRIMHTAGDAWVQKVQKVLGLLGESG